MERPRSRFTMVKLLIKTFGCEKVHCRCRAAMTSSFVAILQVDSLPAGPYMSLRSLSLRSISCNSISIALVLIRISYNENASEIISSTMLLPNTMRAA
jgi:hypothetical protein